MGVKQSTPEPDASGAETDTSATTGNSSSSQSYYFGRLIVTGALLSGILLVMGTLVLGGLAVYFLIRVYPH